MGKGLTLTPVPKNSWSNLGQTIAHLMKHTNKRWLVNTLQLHGLAKTNHLGYYLLGCINGTFPQNAGIVDHKDLSENQGVFAHVRHGKFTTYSESYPYRHKTLEYTSGISWSPKFYYVSFYIFVKEGS